MGLIITPVLAGTQTWTYTTDDSGLWSTPGNWSSGTVPTTDGTDDVQFGANTSGATRTSTVDSVWAASGAVNNITLNDGGTKSWTLATGSGVTLNIAGGITNLDTTSAFAVSPLINATLNFTASQTINMGGHHMLASTGSAWSSAAGTLLTIAGTGFTQFIFYVGSTSSSGFQGSVQLAGNTGITFQTDTSQYSRLGVNTFYVNSLDAAHGNIYGSPRLEFVPTSSGTFANAISFSNFNNVNSGNYQIRGTAAASPYTTTFSGNWSGDIGAGNDVVGKSGIRFTAPGQSNNTNLRFLLTGNNTALTSSLADKDNALFPIQVLRGMLIVDNANALGANNSLLVGLGNGNTGVSNVAGLLAANNRTISSVIRVVKNSSSFSQSLILGVDGAGTSGNFTGNIFLDSSATAAQVPTLQLTASTGSVVTFNGNIQNQGTALANVVPVSITGGGIVSLNGTNTYTGATTVAAGTTLRGTGSLTSSLAVNGILAPGNSIGTLIVGDTAFGTGSSFAVEFDTGTSDLLQVIGNLDISLATLNLSGTADNVTSYTIATYTGSLTGNFTSVVGMPGGYTLNYGTGSNSLIMLMVPEPFSLGLLGLGGGLGALIVFSRRRSIGLCTYPHSLGANRRSVSSQLQRDQRQGGVGKCG